MSRFSLHAGVAARADQRRKVEQFVRREFEAYLKCGRLEHGFLRVRCELDYAEKLVASSCKRRVGARAAVPGAEFSETAPTARAYR